MQLAEIEDQAGYGVCGNKSGKAHRIKLPGFDGTMSWTVSSPVQVRGRAQLDRLAILQVQAVDMLHSIPTEARYKDINEVLKGRYGEHQLPIENHSQLKARTQLIGKSLQQFASSWPILP
jgi:hypothetical protein